MFANGQATTACIFSLTQIFLPLYLTLSSLLLPPLFYSQVYAAIGHSHSQSLVTIPL